MQNREKSLKL